MLVGHSCTPGAGERISPSEAGAAGRKCVVPTEDLTEVAAVLGGHLGPPRCVFPEADTMICSEIKLVPDTDSWYRYLEISGPLPSSWLGVWFKTSQLSSFCQRAPAGFIFQGSIQKFLAQQIDPKQENVFTPITPEPRNMVSHASWRETDVFTHKRMYRCTMPCLSHFKEVTEKTTGRLYVTSTWEEKGNEAAVFSSYTRRCCVIVHILTVPLDTWQPERIWAVHKVHVQLGQPLGNRQGTGG